MADSDRIKRKIAFYFSVILFFVSLPILLSYSLGYQIDYNAFKIYKTGILYINSRPAAASVYINGKIQPSLTPAQIEELKPGTYKVEVRREGFYPWERELVIKPNMVTRADRIVLFPVTQDVKKVSLYNTRDFAMLDKNNLYYMTGSGLFRSNIDGTTTRRICRYSGWPEKITAKKFSPDGDKLLYFNEKNLWIIYLNLDRTSDGEEARVEEVIISEYPVKDAFWYSSSGYIIVVTEKEIEAVEVRGGEKRNIVTLYKFNNLPRGLFYDRNADALYFTDSVKDAEVNYLHRLELRQTFLDSLKQFLIKREAEEPDDKR